MSAPPVSLPQAPGYSILRHLARGGMAEVYEAEQLALQRPVALKILRMADAGGADAIARFEQETRLIAQLRHPNIVGIYEVGHCSDGALYYAMPFLSGGDLAARASPRSPEDIRTLLSRLLDALGYAHGKGVIHRDIKPANVLFDEHGTPQLADFGVALRTLDSERLTQVGLTVGSTGYMSPEQARGRTVDARSDLYSVGVLAYEMLTGSLPFSGADAFEVTVAQLEQKVPRLPRDRAHWQAFIDQALAREPAQRFQSAAEMAAALARIPDKAAKTRIAFKPGKTAGLAAAAMLGVALLGLAVWALWPKKDFTPAEVEQLIASRKLLPPDAPNALEALIDAPAQPEFDRLRERLEETLRAELLAAIDAQRWERVASGYPAWEDASVRLGRAPATRTAVAEALDGALRAALDDAIERYDRTPAEPALAVFARIDQPSEALAARRELLMQIPRRADGIVDPGGPKLSVIKPPTYENKGTAISVMPVSAALYARFVEASGRAPAACDQDDDAATQPAQGDAARCVSYDDARDFAEWFSAQSGQSYRLPSVAEWQAARGQGLTGEGPALRMWSRDCNSVRIVQQPNALRRGLGKVREAFGGRSVAGEVSRSCKGQLSLGAIGSDDGSRAQAAGLRSPEIGIGLVRDIAALPRPAD